LLIVVGKNFEAINSNYPANGKWLFVINAIICEDNQIDSDVSVADGVIHARDITLHTIKNGLIAKQTEFWSGNYEAPAWRKSG